MITGEEVAEHIEMGGREAREKLAMKLPRFGAPQAMKPARRTDSLLSEVSSLPPLMACMQLQGFPSHGAGKFQDRAGWRAAIECLLQRT